MDGRVFKMTPRILSWWFLLSFIVFFCFLFLLSRTILSENTCRALCVRWWSLSLQKNDTTYRHFVHIAVSSGFGWFTEASSVYSEQVLDEFWKKFVYIWLSKPFASITFSWRLTIYHEVNIFRDEVLEWKLFLAGYALFLKVIVSESLSCKIISNMVYQ